MYEEWEIPNIKRYYVDRVVVVRNRNEAVSNPD
jgi:hypothetical protein